jgi:putative heme-binding domain-containing protein
LGLLFVFAGARPDDTPSGRPLEAQLLEEDPVALAQAVRGSGDPARGATIFFQPSLSCTKCHAAGDGRGDLLGPDLAKAGKEATDAYLIDSVLRPSKLIKKGFESTTIATADGKNATGLLAEDQADRVVLRDPAQDGSLLAVLKRDIVERADNGPSIMPAGLVNGLTSRQQFLDLMRYLREIADGGADRARALRPDPSQVAGMNVPAYEAMIDHAGMIAALNAESIERGEAIYDRVCANCHGTKQKPGTMPTALLFASGRFKSGSDPYSLYRTLTHGFRQMPPQTWMVPSQKYDVIHFLRETFLKRDNPSQYATVDRAYLDRLPKGTTRGPRPSKIEAWSAMDYGPALTATYEVGNDQTNFAYKGIAIRLDAGTGGVSRGRHWAVFDEDTLRVAACWSGDGFIDWNGVNFNGRHEIHPKVVGQVAFASPTGPGWANPDTGTFNDPRLRGRDDRPYGPLPRSWAHYRGQYRHGDQVIFAYTVGNTEVLERPAVETQSTPPVFSRTFNVGPRDRAMVLQVARGPRSQLRTLASGDGASGAVALLPLEGDSGRQSRIERRPVQIEGPADVEISGRRDIAGGILAGVSPAIRGATWSSIPAGDLRLTIPAGKDRLAFALKVMRVPEGREITPLASSIRNGLAPNLAALTGGGPARWPEVIETAIESGGEDGPFAVDALGIPESNPWLCQMRLTGFDFLKGGRQAAVCTWDGDVWLVSGLEASFGKLRWKRIASGLFQPLGLKVHDGNIFVGCRDQIVILRDQNGDGEIDFYENFNNDHQVTEHFHEFAMDLQTGPDGSFYYAKAARHGKTALVPQHGTLLRVSPDGLRTDILATGFRAPNGVCLNDDGTFFLTDQEGFWTPKNRINHVKAGGFYGNMWGYHNVTDPSDSAMEPPVCWITNDFDRSPAEIVRVTSGAWGPLKGSLLNLSYGNGKLFVVFHETVAGVMQGGMCALPIPSLPTGVMRGRFHPRDGQLYGCGMYAWAGNQTAPGGFYRIRATGKPMFLPTSLHATRKALSIKFTEPLDRASASDPSHYALKTWGLKRTENYGSERYDEKTLHVTAASVSDDGRTVSLTVRDIQPTWGMEISYWPKTAQGKPCVGLIHNTMHHLSD